MKKTLEELIQEIDQMTCGQMLRIYRFGKLDDEHLIGEAGEYFKYRLYAHFFGLTPEISKRIGW